MKIKLFANEKLYEFFLPSEVFGSYTFDDDNSAEFKLINIEANNGTWYLNSTRAVKVYNNNEFVYNTKLDVNKFYILERDNIKYLILVEALIDNTFKKYKYYNNTNLVVGNDKKCNVNYTNNYIKGVIFNIKYKNNVLVLEKKSDIPIYINNNIVYKNMDITKLNTGDVIEVFGLKIILAENILLINNPLDHVFVNKLTAYLDDLEIPRTSQLMSMEIKENDLYSPNSYFAKSPRIRRIITNKTIKIDAPPQINDNDEIPLIYSLGPMVTMGMTSAVSLINVVMKVNSGETTYGKQWMQLTISISMLLSTLLWPYLTRQWNKRQKNRRRRNSIKKYKLYLKGKKKDIEEESKLQKDILIENLLPNKECLDIILKGRVALWSKRIEQKDFLTARIGIGDYPLDVTISCPEENFSVDDNVLKDEAINLVKEFELLKDVPVGYSFLDHTITAVMGNNYKVHKLLENIILQLITFHSYEDLKIVIFTDNKNKDGWEFVKYLPHNFDNSRQIRFFSTNSDDAKEISSYLEQELFYRRYDGDMNEVVREYTDCKPYYLIITDNYVNIRRLDIMKDITEINNNYGFSLVILENLMSRLPSKCNNFITIGDKSSSILENAYENQRTINFMDEIDYDINMADVSKKLFNIPIEFEKGGKELPNTITFLEMEAVGKVEGLNIINRWRNNDPTKSLRAEVGIDENGDTVYLDLHEKYHGPHGLIAGMTGSGKSEFIITYVLSMAINYSPDIVSFILIDYKGGGLAGAFENKNAGIKLPHLAGVITNLDKAEISRTLVSIDSELRRRQVIFNKARDLLGESTIDIYKYQKYYLEGKLTEAVPHLIIICDEFAELKSSEPEFMDDLISIARIGRSLGVHLILATQKPSGVVNDQIWSNSKFRVCLKVQEKNDSMEMLKRPEAAEIKNVGRFYLQVGYNELFMLGQSAWAGAKYYPSDKVKKNIDHSVNVIDDIGYIRRSIEAASKTEEAHGEELANILGNIIETANRLGVSSNSLWLDNIPSDIYIDNIVNKYNISFYKNIIEAIIGEYDDPSNQRQFVLKVNLNNNGNTIIFGSDGNDREMCLDSIIYSTTTRHSTKEINYYIIDYGSEALRKFSNFPHIGDMVFANEEEKLNNLMKMIKDIIKERKKLFISYSGNYNTYIRESKEELPLIGVIINNYDAFYEGNVSVDEEFASLTRDALRYGIFFIITASGDNSIRRKIKQNFNTILALRLNDEMAYNSIFTKINNLPKDTIGRGLFKTDKVYEFQTADIIDTTKENEYLINIGNRLKEINNFVARRVPTLPDIITPNTVSKYLNGINSIPIGISKNSLEVVTYDFTTYLTTFILGSSVSNTINFSRSLLYEIASIKNIQLILVDMNSDLIDLRGMIRYYFNENPNNIIDLLIDYIDKIKDKNIKSVIYFQDFNKFKIKVDDKKLEDFVKSIKYLENISIIIVDDYKKIKKSEYDTWYRNMQNDTDGIWIGTGLYDQNLFKLSKLTKEMGNTYKNNFAYVITDGRADLIKTIELEEYREQGDNDE